MQANASESRSKVFNSVVFIGCMFYKKAEFVWSKLYVSNEKSLCLNHFYSDAFNHSVPTLTAAYSGWTVVCKANTNSDSCSYKWKELLKTHSDGNEHTNTVSNCSTMTLSTPGRFRCEARCSLRGHTCLIFPIAINVQEAVPVTSARVGNFAQTTAVSTKSLYLAVCLSVILLISEHLY